MRPFFKDSQINIFYEDHRGDGVQHVGAHRARHRRAVRGLRARGVEFMPTPGTYYDMLPERLAADRRRRHRRGHRRCCASSRSSSTASATHEVPAADLPEGVGRPLRRSRGRAVLLRDHPAQGRSNGFGAGNFRALFESIERAAAQERGLHRACRDARAHASSATVPTKHHIALRDAAASCATRSASRATASTGRTRSSITSTGRTRSGRRARARLGGAVDAGGRGARPLAQAPLPDAGAGRGAAGARRRRARAAALQRATSSLGVAAPDGADPSTSPTATATSSIYVHEGGGTLRTMLGDLRVRAGRLRLRAARPAPSLRARRGRAALAVDRVRRRRRAAQAVAQRGRPAAHGRAVLAPRLQAARVRRARSTRASAPSSSSAAARSTASRYDDVAARRRRLGRHGLSVGVPDPQLPAARRARCTCRRPGTARSPRAARSSAASCRGRSTSTPTPIPCPYPHARSTATSSSSTAAATSRRAAASAPAASRTIPRAFRTARIRARYEGSIGATRTDELAVMLDTYQPLSRDGGGARRRGSGLSRLVLVGP